MINAETVRTNELQINSFQRIRYWLHEDKVLQHDSLIQLYTMEQMHKAYIFINIFCVCSNIASRTGPHLRMGFTEPCLQKMKANEVFTFNPPV